MARLNFLTREYFRDFFTGLVGAIVFWTLVNFLAMPNPPLINWVYAIGTSLILYISFGWILRDR